MQYRLDKKSGNKLSVLGFGCMRLPMVDNEVDKEKFCEMIDAFLDAGFNNITIFACGHFETEIVVIDTTLIGFFDHVLRLIFRDIVQLTNSANATWHIGINENT